MKRNKLILIALFYVVLISSSSFAQNQTPVVDNVRFSQRTDGSLLVDIYYDVIDADGDNLYVSIRASEDGGSTWDFAVTRFSEDSDIGFGITSGTNKRIVWKFGEEHPGTFGNQYIIEIIADDELAIKGLVAFYPFNGNANDESGNGNDGTVNGAALTTDRFGNANSAYLFDGENDYIRVPHTEFFNFEDKISISYWVKLETDAPYYFPYHIIEKYGSWGSGQRNWDVNFGIEEIGHVWQTSLVKDKFYNLTFTFDGSCMNVYLDGILKSSDLYSGKIPLSESDIMIGEYLPAITIPPSSGDYYFDGTIDDIRIYNYALSISEIEAIYSENGWPYTSTGIPCPGMPTVTYSGKTYSTVQIGAQCWLKENLDVGTMIKSSETSNQQTDNGTIEKYCYNNDASNCEIYGGLYEWQETMQYGTEEGSKGICPQGWHIPTLSEFSLLGQLVEDKASELVDESQNPTGYISTNSSGFSALFGGARGDKEGRFQGIGNITLFWCSRSDSEVAAERMLLNGATNTIYILSSLKNSGFSIRCIMD